MKKNKIMLSIGTIGATALPMAAVVACGGEEKTRHFDLLPTYTGQADQLIALGIHADYYPLQLNASNPYTYLTNPGKFMTQQTKEFKEKFAAKLKDLMPATKGTSWWNQDALDSDEQGSDPSYWTKQEGGLLLYEHYLLDDDRKIIDNHIAPKHDPAATVQTNFRASRDPFTRIPKGVFYAWDATDEQLSKLIAAGNPVSASIDSNKGVNFLEDTSGTVQISVDDLKIVQKLKNLKTDEKNEGSWSFNDKYFVDSYHRMFLDNKDFQNSAFANWLIDSSNDNPFGTTVDGQPFADNVQKLFDASTFQEDETQIGIGPKSNAGNVTAAKHHPIYEQQGGEIGAAPMFEGAMRDNQLYLFNVAWQMTNIVTYGTPYGQQHLSELPATISKEDRDGNLKVAQSKEEAERVKNYLLAELGQEKIDEMAKALPNAIKITTQLKERMADIKTYINAVKTEVGKAADPLTFGVFTVAPGHGESTIQTMSKFSFLYKELGFKQPSPDNLSTLAAGAEKFTQGWDKVGTSAATNKYLSGGVVSKSAPNEVTAAIGDGSLFNMDDNGWFWTLGESGKLSTIDMDHFKGDLDLGVIASRDANFDAEIIKDKTTNAISAANMFDTSITEPNKAVTLLEEKRVNYDLWNEGIKTPFVMHMVLDQIISKVNAWAKGIKNDFDASKITGHADAVNWGNYFTTEFIK